MRAYLFVFGVLVVATFICLDPGDCKESGFVINLNTNGSYSILVNGNTWLTSGDTVFNNNGASFSLNDKSLKLVNVTMASGTDHFGIWQSLINVYKAGDLIISTTIKTYIIPDLPFVIFSQRYLTDADGTSPGAEDLLISQFPSFKLGSESADLGYVSYGGNMVGWSGLLMGSWAPMAYFKNGIQGGPLVLFDNSSNAIVISPFSQFMAASNHIRLTQQISWGIMGLVNRVPQNYSIDFILYYSGQGINQAMRGWGEVLTKTYNKDTSRRDNDFTINYLGYWTDNGAYYYYHTENSKNYQDTVLDTVNYTNSQKIPFRYLQFDSWWYRKGHIAGTKTWEPLNNIFPNGFPYIANKTHLPFGCHNRYWDSQTTYAKYNGGQYNFISDKSGAALVDDDQFWIDLFNMTQQWGDFLLYEQDWLDYETQHNVVLLDDLFIGRRWLTQMGKGAALYKNINIQYCMAYSRHILQSLEIPVVTQARVSGDYSPSTNQWKIGISSIFADAVNIAPFKDTFWTTVTQPGNPYGRTEQYPELNNIIATLSAGPVGPGDGIGYINSDLLMRCCDAEGQILKPKRPATAIDDQMKRAALKTYPGPDGEVYTTYTNISNHIFGIVLAADMSNYYFLTPSAGWTDTGLMDSMVFSGTDAAKTPIPFSESVPLLLGPQCSKANFCLYYTSPTFYLSTGENIVLMGEVDKWVPMSHKRFSSLLYNDTDVIVQLNLQAEEMVFFHYFIVGSSEVVQLVCDNTNSSTPAPRSTISITKMSCTVSA